MVNIIEDAHIEPQELARDFAKNIALLNVEARTGKQTSENEAEEASQDKVPIELCFYPSPKQLPAKELQPARLSHNNFGFELIDNLKSISEASSFSSQDDDLETSIIL